MRKGIKTYSEKVLFVLQSCRKEAVINALGDNKLSFVVYGLKEEEEKHQKDTRSGLGKTGIQTTHTLTLFSTFT